MRVGLQRWVREKDDEDLTALRRGYVYMLLCAASHQLYEGTVQQVTIYGFFGIDGFLSTI